MATAQLRLWPRGNPDFIGRGPIPRRRPPECVTSQCQACKKRPTVGRDPETRRDLCRPCLSGEGRRYQCGHCGRPGHNRRQCPNPGVSPAGSLNRGYARGHASRHCSKTQTGGPMSKVEWENDEVSLTRFAGPGGRTLYQLTGKGSAAAPPPRAGEAMGLQPGATGDGYIVLSPLTLAELGAVIRQKQVGRNK